MIDEKTLAEDEREQKMLAAHYANKPEMVVMFKKRIAVIRNARRYLALRELFKTEWLCNYIDYGPGKELESSSARLQLDIPSTTAAMGSPPTSLVDGNVIDEAADRLLEGGE